MELSNEFVVPVDVDEAWTVLSDLARIAPCMPGAELRDIQGDQYRGVVKVKVGPITASYEGKATFLEKDEPSHKLVIRAEGRDTRGQGNAQATITAVLTPVTDGTHVSVMTDLAITGRAAQFGRGVLADVSTKLLGQFVNCLEKNVLCAGEPTSTVTEGVTGRDAVMPPAEPVDLLSTVAATPLFKRLCSGVLFTVGLLLVRRRRRRRAGALAGD